MKKNVLLVLASILVALPALPIQSAQAESYTYTLEVAQPVLEVSITNTTTEYNKSSEIDRNNPTINLDILKVNNTGDTDANIKVKGTMTRTDGGASMTSYEISTPTSPVPSVTTYSANIIDPVTKNIIKNVTGTESIGFGLLAGQAKDVNLDLRLNKDFNGAISYQFNINAVAK